MKFIIRILSSGLAVFASAYIIPGVFVQDFYVAIIVAVVLGVLSAILKPILTILTLPINMLTFGLFSFVINTAIVLLVSYIVPGFAVSSFLTALAFGIVLFFVSSFLGFFGA